MLLLNIKGLIRLMPEQEISTSVTNDIHVVIPGLEAYFRYLQLPYTATLKKLLERAEKNIIANDYYGLLNKLFGYSSDNDSDLGLAALRLCESDPSYRINNAVDDYYMCADPVYMQADRDQLLMFDSQELNIQTQEADTIVTDLNEHFKEEGLKFIKITNSQWIVRINQICDVDTVALYKVINRPLANVMPTGQHGKKWKSILNEVQMFLYAHKINDERQEKGLKAINGIWFWGAGTIPQASTSTKPLTHLYADVQWIRALAKINKIDLLSTNDIGVHLFARLVKNASSHLLYFDDSLSNEYSRLSAQEFMTWLENTEKKLFLALEKNLNDGQIDQVYMYPGDGCRYSIKPGSFLSSVKRVLSSISIRLKSKFK